MADKRKKGGCGLLLLIVVSAAVIVLGIMFIFQKADRLKKIREGKQNVSSETTENGGGDAEGKDSAEENYSENVRKYILPLFDADAIAENSVADSENAEAENSDTGNSGSEDGENVNPEELISTMILEYDTFEVIEENDDYVVLKITAPDMKNLCTECYDAAGDDLEEGFVETVLQRLEKGDFALKESEVKVRYDDSNELGIEPTEELLDAIYGGLITWGEE